MTALIVVLILSVAVLAAVCAGSVTEAISQRRRCRQLELENERLVTTAQITELTSGRNDAWLKGMVKQAVDVQHESAAELAALVRDMVTVKPTEEIADVASDPDGGYRLDPDEADWSDQFVPPFGIVPSGPMPVFDVDDPEDAA